MAQTVHLKLKLAKGGDIQGESSLHDLERENTIECSSFNYGVLLPSENANNSATGKRQHSPVVIRKRLDKSTPLLIKALCQNDQVESAEFRFYRPAGNADGEEHFYTVKIEKGLIASVKQLSEDVIMAGEKAPPAMEEVSFTFQNITWTYETGGVMHTDSWSGQ